MKKLRCRKEFGVWYYEKTEADDYNELDATLYTLYDERREFVATFCGYGDMKYFVETGKILS